MQVQITAPSTSIQRRTGLARVRGLIRARPKLTGPEGWQEKPKLQDDRCNRRDAGRTTISIQPEAPESETHHSSGVDAGGREEAPASHTEYGEPSIASFDSGFLEGAILRHPFPAWRHFCLLRSTTTRQTKDTLEIQREAREWSRDSVVLSVTERVVIVFR